MDIETAMPQTSGDMVRTASLSGLIQVRYQVREDQADGCDVRRARLSVKGIQGKRLSYRLQGEFGGTGQKLLDAVLVCQVTRFASVHAGQFIIPFSYENLISSGRLASVNRSQVVEALCARGGDVLGNHSGRDIGIMVQMQNSYLDMSAGVFNGSGINRTDLNEDKDIIGRLVLRPVRSLGIGCSFYSGRMIPEGSMQSVARRRMGAEFSWNAAVASVSGEYIRGRDDVTEKAGWYTQAVCEIPGIPISMLMKYDTYDPDLDRTNTTTSVITAGCTAALNEYSSIQFNYEWKSEDVEVMNNVFVAQIQYRF